MHISVCVCLVSVQLFYGYGAVVRFIVDMVDVGFFSYIVRSYAVSLLR